ncbi:MAG: ATP-binding protein [Bdellovibrionales bacterium]|nr:ATP-binding protein [Bdellovibrionales bacterium]
MKKHSFHRLNKAFILKDLKKKMVLLTGPRQVGKTWLAKQIMNHYKNPLYLNYDSLKDKKMIKEQSWLESVDLIVFDEIHKMDQWKNYIKGIFDTRPQHRNILVTGSARLQQIQRSGDSLAGRFFSHTLLPFSLFELSQTNQSIGFNKLFSRGGFPEPLLMAKSINEAERWRQQYMFSLLREDIPDFKNLQNYRKMETLLYLLREKMSSPISINSLSQALGIDHKTVEKYITVLKDLFIIFSVPSFSKNIARSLSKTKKIYFYDYAFIDAINTGGRWENIVALHLLKHCLYLQETQPSKALQLVYLRTKDKREVDFLLTKKGSPHLMIEVKSKEVAFSKNLIYFHDRYGIPGKQLCPKLKRQKQIKGKNIISESLETFLLKLKT